MKNLKTILLLFLALPSIGISQYVFSSKQELKDAVDMYVNYRSIGLDTYGEINTWDVINITDMSELFMDKETFNEDISNWNTSNVVNMRYMFSGATSFNQNIESWDTSNVVYMSGMFKDAHSFNQDIGNWNTSNVFDMDELFYYATDFNQDIGYWDTSIVRNMDSMFFYAESFNQDIANWNVSNVTNMSSMFSNANSFNRDIGNWDTSNVFDMSNMFQNASNFNQNIGSWNVVNVHNMSLMFYRATNFDVDISSWNVNNVIDVSLMFYDASSFNQDISNWDFNISSSLFFEDFLSYSGLSTANYSELIKKITQKYINGTYEIQYVEFGAENLKYCNPDYRQYMIDNFGWQFYDGGQLVDELSLISEDTTENQSICENNEIEQIIYGFGSDSNSASVNGLPPGLNWYLASNTINIEGTVTENVSEPTTYNYNVIIDLENYCSTPSVMRSGSITINPNPEINLSTPLSTANQFICEGAQLTDIVYNTIDGAENVDLTWDSQPNGIYGQFDFTTNQFTISGTPTGLVEDKVYNYTIQAINSTNGCESPELTGEITVKANAELTLLSSTISLNQTVCVNSNISDIRIRFKNSSVPSANNLPSGLSSEVVGTDVLRIFGSVSVGGPYTFDVIGTNTNGCSSTAVTVQLTVVPDYSINPTKVVLDMNDPANGTDESLVKNISCYGNRDGEIMVNISNSSSGLSYIYSWSGPSNYVNTTQSNHIKNLSPGTYNLSVYAQGQQDCAITQSFTILQPQPTEINVNTISPVSCTGSDDGLISVSVTGGNSFYFKNYIWEVLEEYENCVTYTIKLRDADNDGIFDIVDADIDNDGVIDPNKTDSNWDGIVDEASNNNFSYSIVSYQSCDGTFITDNKQQLSDFSVNGTYHICAVPNSVSSDANLDHDLDANTQNISSVTVTGGTASCSPGTWQEISRLKGTTYADNLLSGLYRLTVVEGPDLTDIESLDIDDLRNDLEVCITDEIFELPKDQILYGSVSVDDAYCSLSGGYIDIDVNQSAGQIFFKYDGIIVPSSDVSVIASEFGVNTYRVLISAPISDASFEIENANGCGIVVAQDLLDTTVLTPVINYTSPEFEESGTINEGSNILFTLAGNTSYYYRVEWDFGDSSPVVTGETVSHQYFADGTYNVTVYVYNASGCFTTATKVINVDATASTKDYSNSITIYPNPTSSIINIEQDFTTAKVYDISGRELLKTTSKTIDLSELPSSIYLLRLYDKSNKVLGTSKVVKQ